MAELTAFSAAQAEALSRWLQQLSGLHGASDKTVQAYGRDLRGFLAFLSQHHGAGEGLGALDALPHTDLRAWMAAERGRGLSARSLARSLSAVKNFLGWLSQQNGSDATIVLSARGPKFARKLPRPLTEKGAQDVLDDIGAYARQDWIGARDTAVVTLLYGCGLRISEALGLTGAAHPLPEVLRIRGKGDKDRLVPVCP
jgi:integrase/recombinase XerC